LIFTDNDGNNKRFHEYMHELDERWPADGENTGYIDILPEGVDASLHGGCEVCGSIKRDENGQLLHFDEDCFK
jgi:hypothetical protein